MKLVAISASLIALFAVGALIQIRAAQPLTVARHVALYKMVDSRAGPMITTLYAAVRSDGSVLNRLGGDSKDHIHDATSRTQILIDHKAHTVLRSPIPRKGAEALRYKEADCTRFFNTAPSGLSVACESTGEHEFGYPLVKVTLSSTLNPTGTPARRELWVIKELGWIIVRSQNYGLERSATFHNELVQLKVGEPPASDFNVPKDYAAVANYVEWRAAELAARQQTPMPRREFDQLTKA